MLSTATDLQTRKSNVVPWIGFLVFVFSGFALFFVPAFIIRPFRQQTSGSLSLAMATRQIAPLWTLVAVIAAFVIAIALWRQVSKAGKVLLVGGMVLGCASATMARLNYFEWMFHPVGTPGFESPLSARLDNGEMVMAVNFGNQARAYPIRAMAYHHVVNDVVDGIPIAVTY
jgi:hypothetical protein